MSGKTTYADERDDGLGFYKVTFINERGVRLTRSFDSPYFTRQFVNKLRRSKKCKLVSYPSYY